MSFVAIVDKGHSTTDEKHPIIIHVAQLRSMAQVRLNSPETIKCLGREARILPYIRVIS